MAKRMQQAQQWAKLSKGFMGSPKFRSLIVVNDVKIRHKYGSVFCIQYSPNGETFAVGYESGGLEIRDAKKGTVVHDLRLPQSSGFAVMCVRFCPNKPSMLYAATAEGIIYVFDVAVGTIKHIIYEMGNEINTLAFNHDATQFVTGGKDFKIKIYDTNTSNVVSTFGLTPLVDEERKFTEATPSLTQRVFCIKYHPEEHHVFISSGWDNDLKIWDCRAAYDALARRIYGPHVCGEALDIKNGMILTGSWVASDSLALWSYNNGSLIKSIPFPNDSHCNGDFLYCTRFCGSDAVLAGGSGTNSAHLISISDGKCLGDVFFQKSVFALDTANQGQDAVVGGADSALKMVIIQ